MPPAESAPCHQVPSFGIEAQGSAFGSGSPIWRSSTEIPSGVFQGVDELMGPSEDDED